MTAEEKMALARYISSYSQQQYKYGYKDCMLFPVEWHDVRFKTTTAKSIRGKYDSKVSAYKFYKNFTSVESWLKYNGYECVEDETILDGDMVVSGIPELPLVYIGFNNAIYSMTEDGLYGYLPGVVNIRSIWRK